MRTALLASVMLLAAAACRSAPRAASALAPIPAGAVRHVVVFRFKPDASPEKIAELTAAFAALRDSIPGILAFEHGVNVSPERLNADFTHVYTFTFASAAARDAYLVHPAHKAFGALVGRLGIWNGAFVVDYVPVP